MTWRALSMSPYLSARVAAAAGAGAANAAPAAIAECFRADLYAWQGGY